MARCVDSVSEEHYSFSTFDRFELFLQEVVNCVVQTRAAAAACMTNGVCDFTAIGRGPAFDVDSVVKRHDHHAICRFELVDEFDCGVLNVAETEFGGTTRVDQQDDAERRVGSGEVSNLLVDAVFLNAKVFAAKQGDVM